MCTWLWRDRFAILCVWLAGPARMLLNPVTRNRHTFPTFYVAPTQAAGDGGRGPVLLALALGYFAASCFFVAPRFSVTPEHPVAVGVFSCVGLAIAAFTAFMHMARDQPPRSGAQAIRKQTELEHESVERERARQEREAPSRGLDIARQRLEAVLQQMPAGVIIAEAPSGRLVLANDQAQAIWQQPFVAAAGSHGDCDDSGPAPEGHPYWPHPWPLSRSLVMGEAVTEEEIEFPRGDGTRGTMCVSSAPIRDPEGMIIAAVLVFHDITARKRAEDELRRAREELELRVAERTAALAETSEALRAEVLDRRQAERARNDLLGRLVDVQEEERSRITRELHDQMGQQLTALKLGLEALDAWGLDEITRHDRLQELLDLTRQIGRDVHRIAWELGPSALDGYDLPTALSSYAEEWSGHSRVPLQFHCSGGWVERPSSQVEATVYRVVQEALTNVSKHARAERLSLIVDRRDDQLLAIVEDDGVGFDLHAMAGRTARGRGLGLIGMRRRVEAIGGSFQIESCPGNGTTVFVRIPENEAARLADA